jgi:hypothetical protein
LHENASPEPLLSAIAQRIDLVSGLNAARVVRHALEPEALFRTIAAWRRAGGLGLIAAPLPAAALADPAAFDAGAKASGVDPRATSLELDGNAVTPAALSAVATLRARGWGLGLRMSPGPAAALDARARALFATFTAQGLWEDVLACQQMQTRLRAAQAQGAQLVWAGTAAPNGPHALRADGYDAVEVTGPSAVQTALARAVAEQASSFSNR